MIEFMAEDGIVGPYNGSKPREVIMTLSDWKRRRSAGINRNTPIPKKLSPTSRQTTTESLYETRYRSKYSEPEWDEGDDEYVEDEEEFEMV
jgi:S-DNA-T family DNA segregation ATPase FtsK/SpoIIIE